MTQETTNQVEIDETNAWQRSPDAPEAAPKSVEAEKRWVRYLTMINTVGKKVLSTLDMDELLQETASAIQACFEFYDVNIFFADHESQDAVLRAHAGGYIGKLDHGYRQSFDVGIVGWVIRNNEPRLTNDLHNEELFYKAFPGEEASNSELCVPIKGRDKVLGAINVESQSLRAFGDEDVLILETLADQIAEATETILLYAEMTQVRCHLEQMMNYLPLGINSEDLSGVYTRWSPGSERLFGYSAGEMVGKESPKKVLPEDYDFRSDLERCKKEGKNEFEVMAIRKDGSLVPIHVVRVKLYDDAGNHIGYTAYMQDITERRKAEEGLLREKQKLDDIVRAIGGGLSLLNKDLRVTWVNETMSEWFEFDEDKIGCLCHDVYSRPGKTCDPCPAVHALSTGSTGIGQQVFLSKTGRRRHFQHVVTPIRNGAGEVVQLLKLTQDVTEHAERVYQLSMLRQLGELMQGTLELDRLLHLTLICVTAGYAIGFNRALLLMVNEENQTLEGRMWVGPRDASHAARLWDKIIEKARTLEELLHLYDSDKEIAHRALDTLAKRIEIPLSLTSEVPIAALREKKTIVVRDAADNPMVSHDFYNLIVAEEFICVPVLARSEAIGVIVADNLFNKHPITEQHEDLLTMFAFQAGLAIDNAVMFQNIEKKVAQLEAAYTELADTQQQLVESERLAAIGKMAAHVAHEIRNPLVTIGGFARSSLKPGATEERVKRNTEIIANEVDRLEKILSNVMDFAKPSKPILKEENINDILGETCSLFDVEMSDRHIDVHLQLDDRLPPVNVDSHQMRQVFINMIRNAIDSMPAGGDMYVATRTQREADRLEPGAANSAKKETMVVAEVQDSGQGIPSEYMESIFDPFFTTKSGGTGLGLAVAQKIAHDHGGDIRIESKPGAGATVRVILPIESHLQGRALHVISRRESERKEA